MVLVGPGAGMAPWERRAVQGNRGSRVVRLVAVLDDLLAWVEEAVEGVGGHQWLHGQRGKRGRRFPLAVIPTELAEKF